MVNGDRNIIVKHHKHVVSVTLQSDIPFFSVIFKENTGPFSFAVQIINVNLRKSTVRKGVVCPSGNPYCTGIYISFLYNRVRR